MCLILIAWQAHPDYPLVLAANRDEFHARAAAPAAWWDLPPILAGRDLSAGGTWLGVTRGGRFAALTNFRDPERIRGGVPTRGEIVPQVLASPLDTAAELQRLRAIGPHYNGFNLLFGDRTTLAVYESVSGRAQRLGPGIYGLSNHLLDTPWPKVRTAKSALAESLRELPDVTALLALLRDDRPADDGQLPRTGVSLQWERLLSSAFIRGPDYGTRCSTIWLCDRHGGTRFTEWSWNAHGQLAGRVEQLFPIGEEG